MGRAIPILAALTLFAGLALADGRAGDAREARALAKLASEQLAQAMRHEIARVLEALDDEPDFEASVEPLQVVFDTVIAYASPDDAGLFEDAAGALRLVRQAARAGDAMTPRLWAALRRDEAVARALAFAMVEQDRPAGAYALLGRLYDAHAAGVAEHPQLTAALCVVHDFPLVRHVNENRVKAADPVDVWSFYAAHEDRMMYGLKGVPTALLVYVVDNPASIEEMRWAMARYRGDARVGRRYHDIAYDRAHLQSGAPKTVTERGFNLPNIKQYGGVCADQAYFAATVGKSIGVPTTSVSAVGTQMGHAWVGFLESRNRRAWWNFDEGCWNDYKKLIGRVHCPQRRRGVSDAEVGVLAEMIGASLADVRQATALTDAALRLAAIDAGDEDYPPPPPADLEADVRRALGLGRSTGVEARLALLESALRRCQGCTPAWAAVAASAGDPAMTFEIKARWAELIGRLCGREYPAYMVQIVSPLIESIDDPGQQVELWERLYNRVRREPELAASVCLRMGAMWEAEGARAKAYDCYRAVVIDYTDDGRFALTALDRCEAMLRDAGREDVLVELLGEAFERCERPSVQSPFGLGSMWTIIGTRYADALSRAGRLAEAGTIRNQLASQAARARR